VSGRHRRERRQPNGPPAPAALSITSDELEMPATPPHGAGLPCARWPVVSNAGNSRTGPSPETEELLKALASVQLQRRELEDRQRQLVEALLRARVSWGRLGAALGVSRQAAHKRYSSA
jgi:hypothetical protein